MSVFEIVVVAVGMVVGYGLVSFVIGKVSRPAQAPKPASVPAWHDVLEVTPSASVDEIRAAYRQLMSQYHPDKVAALGADLRALAERKSTEINLAYRESMRVRGFDG